MEKLGAGAAVSKRGGAESSDGPGEAAPVCFLRGEHLGQLSDSAGLSCFLTPSLNSFYLQPTLAAINLDEASPSLARKAPTAHLATRLGGPPLLHQRRPRTLRRARNSVRSDRHSRLPRACLRARLDHPVAVRPRPPRRHVQQLTRRFAGMVQRVRGSWHSSRRS